MDWETNIITRWFSNIYFVLSFYLNYYLLSWIWNPFQTNEQRLENQIKPKAIIDGLMENFAGAERKLINANESVEETYLRMINGKEYDLALKLAKKFDLEIDLIYKSMWNYNEKSIVLIDECLTKITQPLWTLDECINCVPRQLDVVRHLLKFGTNISIQNNLDSNDVFRFEVYQNSLNNYLEKLELYEKILHSNFGDNYVQHFDSAFYRSFRQQSFFQLAIEYANKADIKTLAVMFEHEKQYLFPHYLVILSNLPETLSPINYRSLIDIVFSFNENINIDKELSTEYENEFYLNNAKYMKFKADNKFNSQLLKSWFVFRANEILDYTCLVNNSLDLLQIGIEHNLELQDLFAEFDLYSLLIYDICKMNVTFEEFEKLTITEKMNLFLNNRDNIVLIESLFESFFAKIENYNNLKKFQTTKKELLKNFFINMTKIDFEQCLKIFEIYTMVNRTEDEIKYSKIINDPSDLIELALDCINSYDHYEDLNIAFKIMECLPERDQANLLIGHDPEKIQRFNQVNDEADEIEYCLSIIELLQSHNTNLTVKDLVRLSKSDKNQMIQFVEKAINNFCKIKSSNTDKSTSDILEEWKLFFLNLKDLKKKYLNIITDEELVELAVKCLLLSSKECYIEIAFNHIDLQSNTSSKRLNYEKGKSILKQVAKDYLMFADPEQDDNIKFVKMCLDFIHSFDPDDTEVLDDLNFIEAVKILYREFDFHILPIKIKNMTDMDLIESILTSSKNAHTKVQIILTISSLLKLFNHLTDPDEKKAKFFQLIGEKALQYENYKSAIDMGNDIMDLNLKSAWKLCYDIAKLPNINTLVNINQHLRLLSFALAHCPENNINIHYDLLNIIKKIKSIHINHIQEQKVFIDFKGTQGINEIINAS